MVYLSRPCQFKFLKDVFHKFHLVHSWILCPKCSTILFRRFLTKSYSFYNSSTLFPWSVWAQKVQIVGGNYGMLLMLLTVSDFPNNWMHLIKSSKHESNTKFYLFHRYVPLLTQFPLLIPLSASSSALSTMSSLDTVKSIIFVSFYSIVSSLLHF